MAALAAGPGSAPRSSIRDAAAWRVAASVGIAAFAAALIVHLWILQQFPNSGDEFSYLWQAEVFASGRMTAETPDPQPAFAINHIADRDGRRFSKYPPGWPLLLAIGVWFGAPGAVNPLLAALALAGLYRLGCIWAGPRAALLGAIVTGASPFFLLNAGSYFSHPSCLFALTALALALAWAEERGSAVAWAVAGSSFGLAVLIRPFSALLVGVPLVVWFATVAWRQGRVIPAALAFGAGGLPCALFLAGVNHAVTGAWTAMAWSQYDASETIGFGTQGHTLWRGIKLAVRMMGEGVLYTGIVTVPLLVASLRARIRRQGMLWVLLAAPIAGHVFWWTHGGNRYGPRFYFEGLLPFTLLVGAGFARVLDARRSRALVLAGGAVAAVTLVVLSAVSWRQVSARRGLERTVEAAGLTRALVFVGTASADLTRSDLARNPPDYQRAPVLFAISRGPDLDREVAVRYADRVAYVWMGSDAGGTLMPLSERR